MVANPQYCRVPQPAGRFRSWREFYPFYLGDRVHKAASTRSCSLGSPQACSGGTGLLRRCGATATPADKHRHLTAAI